MTLHGSAMTFEPIRRRVWPQLRHVATCLRCGFREATRLTNSYPPRCPNDGWQLEHDVVPFDDGQELLTVNRPGRPIAL